MPGRETSASPVLSCSSPATCYIYISSPGKRAFSRRPQPGSLCSCLPRGERVGWGSNAQQYHRGKMNVSFPSQGMYQGRESPSLASGLSNEGEDNCRLSAFPLFHSTRLTDGVWCSQGWIPTCISFSCLQLTENRFILGLTFPSHPKGDLF